MYADTRSRRTEFKPGSMVLALALTALPIVGLITATHAGAIMTFIDKPIVFKPVTLPKDPPPPEPQQKKVETRNPPPVPLPYVPPVTPLIDPVTPRIETGTTITPFFPLSDPGTGTDLGTKVTPSPPPVIVGTQYDTKFNNVLQPAYPAEEIRGGNSGRVVVRVLVGVDGRVKQVERVSAASDAFFASTERQALTKWRFKPATKDGIPIEQWKTMSLRFEITSLE